MKETFLLVHTITYNFNKIFDILGVKRDDEM